MYRSDNGKLNGIFFTATDLKQTWPAGCPPSPTEACAYNGTNMWDIGPGLGQANKIGTFTMCANFCGECQFTGSPDGMFTTMHFFFYNRYSPTDLETCVADASLKSP